MYYQSSHPFSAELINLHRFPDDSSLYLQEVTDEKTRAQSKVMLLAGKGTRSQTKIIWFQGLNQEMCAQSCLTLQPPGLQPTRLLCPWDFPGKNTRVGCHFLLQSSFSAQQLNLCPLYWKADSLPLSLLGSPCKRVKKKINSELCFPVHRCLQRNWQITSH